MLETPIIGFLKAQKLQRWSYDLDDESKARPGEVPFYYKGLGSWEKEDLKKVVKTDGLERMIKMLDFNSENFTRNLEQEYKGLVENLLENSINNLNSSTSAKEENPLRLSQLISAERNSAQVRPNKITTLVQEAEVYQAQGDINAAINIYQRWLKKYHNNQNKWVVEFNLGVLLRDVGDVVEAKKYLQAVLQKKPHFMLAQLALKQINKK